MTTAFVLWIVITGSGPLPLWEYDTRPRCMEIAKTIEIMRRADNLVVPHKSKRLRIAYCLQRDYTLEQEKWK